MYCLLRRQLVEKMRLHFVSGDEESSALWNQVLNPFYYVVRLSVMIKVSIHSSEHSKSVFSHFQFITPSNMQGIVVYQLLLDLSKNT